MTKDAVLQMLWQNPERYLSGEMLARELKVCITGLFTYIIWSLFAVAMGKAAEVQLWGFTLFIGLMLVVTLRFYYLLYNHN